LELRLSRIKAQAQAAQHPIIAITPLFWCFYWARLGLGGALIHKEIS